MLQNPEVTNELSESDEESGDEAVGSAHSDPLSTANLGVLFQLIDRVIDCLFDLSIAIRNPATRTLRPSKYKSIDVSPYLMRNKLLPPPDVETSETRFQPAEALIERLAFANLERQFFAYQERHHEKLQKEDKADSTDFLESHSQTAVTKYVEKGLHTNDDTSLYAPSEASCATIGDGQLSLLFPPLPKEASDSKYFECQFCYEILAVANTREWRYDTTNSQKP